MEEAKVTCFSSSSYASRPVAFEWEGTRLIVDAILIENRTPTGKVFIVQAGNRRLYELIYDESDDTWRVELR